MTVVTAIVTSRLLSYSAGLACIRITNGLTIGLILSTNPRRRNELLLPAFAASFGITFFLGNPPLATLGLVLGKMFALFIATYPFRRMSVNAIKLNQVGIFLKVVLYTCLLGCGTSIAGISAWKFFVTHAPLTFDFVLSWYCSDALGAAIFIPLYWSYRRKPKLDRVPFFKYDTRLSFALFTAVLAAIFWQTRYPFLFMLFPVLVPVVYTSGFLGAVRAVMVTTVIAVAATTYGHGPLMLIHTNPAGRILILQFYLAVVLVTAFPFAALLMEREKLVSTLKLSEARYRDLARLDGLTLLPNRREFDSFLDISRQRAVRQNTPLSLLLIDIDHFKKLNDQHGHTVGDEYLRKMAVAIASAVPRKTDLVARYGGEEFAVVLDSCDDPGAIMVAERIKAAAARLSQSLVAHNRPPVTISIGVATTLPSLRTSSKTLIDAADQGLYAAKRNGRDRIERGTNLIAQAEAMAI